jgi:Secretion system C-terminal sorting domain
MKLSTLLILFSASLLGVTTASGQANAFIQVLTLNSGNVDLGGTGEIQVTVGNTGPTTNIAVNNVRTQVSVPSALFSLLPNAQQTGIPAGWTITSNNGTTIQLCNGSDVIAPGTQRNIIIKIQGNTIGGPLTVSGGLTFRSGTNCAAPGTLAGNNTADDNGTSSVTVVNPVPVTLTDFNALLVNCEPTLKWTTETEINSDRFEIERSNTSRADWTKIGTVPAQGNSTRKTDYNLTDKNLPAAEKVLYRLKMIDKDGKFTYSIVLPVSVNCNTTKVSVFPNPVQNGRLYVSITGVKEQTEAVLMNLLGHVIAKKNVTNGTNKIDVSSIASGVYILTRLDTTGLFPFKTMATPPHSC